MAMKHIRPASHDSGKEGSGSVRVVDAGFALRYPALFEFLAEPEWAAGEPRETGTMLVFVEEGVFKARMNDRDGGRVAFYGSDSFQGLLEGLERKLKTDELDWRKDKFTPKKGKRT